MTAPSLSRRAPFTDREEFLSTVSAVRPSVPKDDLIVELCTGRTVLDIGCIDHDVSVADELGERWLHARIQGVAEELIGLDILEDQSRTLNDRGFNIQVGDAQDFDLGRTFDVVVAGDIIEHLSNVGGFLASVERHLGPGSVCVVSTPNPFSVDNVVTSVGRNFIGVNPQHTMWLDPRVMWELVGRSGLAITDFAWITTRFSGPPIPGWKGWMARRFSDGVMKRRPVCRRDFAVALIRRSS